VAPPFAHEARAFVERLLLHRDVGAVIQGIDKAGRLFGSIVFHKGNISTELLKQGYATLVSGQDSRSLDLECSCILCVPEAYSCMLCVFVP